MSSFPRSAWERHWCDALRRACTSLKRKRRMMPVRDAERPYVRSHAEREGVSGLN